MYAVPADIRIADAAAIRTAGMLPAAQQRVRSPELDAVPNEAQQVSVRSTSDQSNQVNSLS